jgi:hypothetical protein
MIARADDPPIQSSNGDLSPMTKEIRYADPRERFVKKRTTKALGNTATIEIAAKVAAYSGLRSAAPKEQLRDALAADYFLTQLDAKGLRAEPIVPSDATLLDPRLLTAARGLLNMTQSEVANTIKTPQPMLSSAESGYRRTAAIINRLKEFYEARGVVFLEDGVRLSDMRTEEAEDKISVEYVLKASPVERHEPDARLVKPEFLERAMAELGYKIVAKQSTMETARQAEKSRAFIGAGRG